MSHNEDSAEESHSSTESTSEASVYEGETMCLTHQSDLSDEGIVSYTDERLANSAWTAEHDKEINEELEKEPKDRLEDHIEVDVW